MNLLILAHVYMLNVFRCRSSNSIIEEQTILRASGYLTFMDSCKKCVDLSLIEYFQFTSFTFVIMNQM